MPTFPSIDATGAFTTPQVVSWLDGRYGGDGGGGGSARTGTMVWNGPWSTSASYVYGDVVTHNSMLWVTNTAHSATTPALPGMAFSDDFERPDGPIGQFWDIADPAWTVAGGKASITKTGTGSMVRTGLGADGDGLWTDVVTESALNAPRILFGYADANNTYRFNLNNGWVERVSGGSSTNLVRALSAAGNTIGAISNWPSVTVSKRGGTITATVVAGSSGTTYTATVTDPVPLTGAGWGFSHIPYTSSTSYDQTSFGSFRYTPVTDSPWNVLERRWSTTSLDDVFAPTVLHGQTLLWNATANRWEPGNAGSGGGSATVTEVSGRPGIYTIS